MRGFPGDVLRSTSSCNSTYHEEHEGIEGNSDTALDTEIEASYFFNELAHSIARSFMVDSLVWRLPCPLWLGMFDLTALFTGDLNCQPIPVLGILVLTADILHARLGGRNNLGLG